MVLTWTQRLTQLSILIGTDVIADDEDRQGQVLDECLASQGGDGQDNLNTLRFNDDDLSLIGRLAVGQFGTIDVVRCRLDSKVYVRKTMERRTVLRARAQCYPQFERDILVKALKVNSAWVPHLLCAFQTETSLKLVMHYADGGNMWDVIESSPEGKLPESDIKWWIPQMISAIEWCHSQGFVHRDIKPHNFVLTSTSHLLLVDFGSAAPLHPPTSSGVQFVPREYCLVPCGTCDYISPEILQCHEAALVALELDDGETVGTGGHTANMSNDATCYGRETDWWSFGAMVYEMAFGVGPFFVNDIGRTYVKIINHQTSLKFDGQRTISNTGISLLQGLLCDKEQRLGRHSIAEVKTHQYLKYVDWNSLCQKNAPSNLHLPHFTYSAAPPDCLENDLQPKKEDLGVLYNETEQFSHPFEFSALFKSSQLSGPSSFEATPRISKPPSNINHAITSFIGFSWGPRIDAFKPSSTTTDMPSPPVINREFGDPISRPANTLRSTDSVPLLGVDANSLRFLTPIRRTSLPTLQGHTVSIHRTSADRRIQGRRILSDRDAMQQLVECIGLSARKKVLESGKKPMYIQTMPGRLGHKKEIKRFIPVPKPIITAKKRRGDNMSGASSETESQPPSPTPRPGSAMSRMSGWGGRSTSSLLAVGRITPTLTSNPTGYGSAELGSENLSALQDELNRATLFDQKLRAAERRHDKLLTELSSLERDVGNVSLRLNRNA